MGQNLNPVRTLLGDMASDDYVRFKYGKRLDVALKLLNVAAAGPDTNDLEARLLDMLDLLRGTKASRAGKKEAGANAPEPKRRARKGDQPPISSP